MVPQDCALAERRRASLEQESPIFQEGSIDWLKNSDEGASLRDSINTDATVLTEDSISERVLATHEELKEYVHEILPKMKTSLNAWLDEHHNGSPEKAQELVQYYQERPHLTDFTLETEMHRLDYTLVDSLTGSFIQDKEKIADFFRQTADIHHEGRNILPRCANQSLLADLLAVFMNTEVEINSGDDDDSSDDPQDEHEEDESCYHHQQPQQTSCLMPPHFQVFTKTRRVNFVILAPNNEDGRAGSIMAKAALDLCLPHPTRGHLHVATISAVAQFSPREAIYDYKVESIEIAACSNDTNGEPSLLETAYCLHDLPVPEPVEEEEEEQQQDENQDENNSKQQQGLVGMGGLFMGTQKLWNRLTNNNNNNKASPQQHPQPRQQSGKSFPKNR